MRFTSEILTISVELAEYHFGILALMQIDRSISCEDMRENDFYIFVSSNLELWPSDLKFTPLVTIVHRYVSTKLEVSTDSEKIAGTGRTDR